MNFIKNITHLILKYAETVPINYSEEGLKKDLIMFDNLFLNYNIEKDNELLRTSSSDIKNYLKQKTSKKHRIYLFNKILKDLKIGDKFFDEFLEFIIIFFLSSLKNNNDSFLLKNEIIVNKYFLMKSLLNYFLLIFYILHFNSIDGNVLERRKKSEKFLEDNRKNLIDILFEFVIIFENSITKDEIINFKNINKNDLEIINENETFLECLKECLNSDKLEEVKNSQINLKGLKEALKKLQKISRGIDKKTLASITSLFFFIKKLSRFTLKKNLFFSKISGNSYSNELELLLLEKYNFIKDFTSDSDRNSRALINKLKWHIDNSNWAKAIFFYTQIIISAYQRILSTLQLFSSSLKNISGDITLYNINIESTIRIVTNELKYLFKKREGGWLKTEILSYNPYIVIYLTPTNIITTNGLPNNTFDVFAVKNNKLNTVLDPCSPRIKAITKKCSTSFKIDEDYYVLTNIIIEAMDSASANIGINENFESLYNSEDKKLFQKFKYIKDNFSLEAIYLPWYFDSRLRIYCYSSFSPTGSRSIRGLLTFNKTYHIIDNESSRANDYDEWENYEVIKHLNVSDRLNLFLKKLQRLLSLPANFNLQLFKNEVNTLLMVILLANHYVDRAHKSESLDIVIDNFFIMLDSGEIEVFEMIVLLTSLENKNLEPVHVGTLFNRLYSKPGASKAEAYEEFFILYCFAKFILNGRGGDYFVQLDVSSSALVLCSIILGVKSPKHLNLSDNNFIKNDPYSLLANNFKKEVLKGTYLDSKIFEANRVLSRGLFKKPSMISMYGSGKKNTIKHIQMTLLSLLDDQPKNLNGINKLSEYIHYYLTGAKGSLLNLELIRSSLSDIFVSDNYKNNTIRKSESGFLECGALYSNFFNKDVSEFSDLSEKNLLIHAGIIFINGEPTSLGYTTNLTRISASTELSKSLDVRYYRNNLIDIPIDTPTNTSINSLIDDSTDELEYKDPNNTLNKGTFVEFEDKAKFTRERIVFKRYETENELFDLFVKSFWDIELSGSNMESLIRCYKIILKNYKTNNAGISKSWLNKLIKLIENWGLNPEENYKVLQYLDLKENQDLEPFKVVFKMSKEDKKRFLFICVNYLASLDKFNIAFKANTIHSIDAYLAMSMINSETAPLITNHDCFYILPSHINTYVNNYNANLNNLTISINKVLFNYNFKFKNNLPFFM